jgi:meckelin
MAALVGVVCGLRVNGFLRRTGDLCCTLSTYVFMVAEFCGLFSSALFVLLTIASTVILILYKAQTLFLYTLPSGSQLLVFQLLLSIALLCRLTHTVYLAWSQCNVDIFLIDWERPKGITTPTNQNPEQPSGIAPPTLGPVSIWRTCFVANEWNELQCVRRGSPLLQLLLALLLLQVAGLRHLAEHTPTGHVSSSPWRYSAPHSPLLRFSLTALVFITLAITMRLYMFVVYERFIEHKIHQFTDLCSVSNVSVFIMWHRCYGYYIEGRSVHGHADTNMREMNINFLKEQEDVCGRRGLMPDSDLQTFQIALTRQFRLHYDRILMQTEVHEGHGQGVRGGVNEGMPHLPAQGGGVSEASIAAYEQMNHFLSAFISHNLRNHQYTTKTKVLVERIVDLELHSPEDRCLFYEDPSASFSRLLFYGQEWSLWQLEFLVFAFIDMLATDYVLAAIITFIVARCVSLFRDVLGRRNIKRKTLVDERFLI